MTTSDIDIEATQPGQLTDAARFEELPDSDTEDIKNEQTSRKHQRPWPETPPAWLSSSFLGAHKNALLTATSEAQQKTVQECLPFLLLDDTQDLAVNSFGLPRLNRELHIKFLHKFFEPMPAGYEVIDASRPWFFYWCLQGLTILGEDVSQYRERLMATLRPLQNKSGGFGGGHGQHSHCATTYACILALAIVDGLELVDRDAMWRFLGQVKQADGGFRVAVMAEEDIRGAYCAMTIITLLNLPLDLPHDAPARQHGLQEFTDGLGEWIGRCQTYEGGIAGAPTNEAHGAYAFCALACLSILDAPSRSIPKYLDVNALLTWMVDVQTSPEGGFAGRTNKLVDACYSHWVGGCWALLEAALPKSAQTRSLWNREALTRYLLTCCQQPGKKGGMRDKPSARPDAYHTCYALAGLSAATNHYAYNEQHLQDSMRDSFKAPFIWSAVKASSQELAELKLDEQDVVHSVHPVFVIPFAAVNRARKQFGGRDS